MKKLVLIVCAIFTFAVLSVATPVTPANESANGSKVEKAQKQTNDVATDVAVDLKAVEAQTVSFSGKSDYALSSCEPTFKAILNTGIDRVRPALQPPIS